MKGSMTFTRSTILCLPDLDGFEQEIECEGRYRAVFDRDWRGYITSLRFEVDDSRKPDIENWQPTVLPADETHQIALHLDRVFRAEQYRMAEEA